VLIAELSGARQFRLLDAPAIPDPAPGEVQVAVRAVGICGSDTHYFAEGAIGDTPCIYPMVLGHEPSGAVVKAGAGVSGWSPGDAAVLEPALYCYHCEFCLTGHHNVCANIRFLSSPQDPGFFRELVNLPACNLLRLPANLSLSEGALVEPLAVVLHSMKFAAPQNGDTAVVFGAGPIGLLTIALLKLSGVSRVWAVEPVGKRRELARVLGADAMIDPAATDPVQQVLQDTGKRGVDFAIDCASQGDSTNQAIRATRSAGRVVITGIPSEEYVSLASHVIRRKELAIYTVRRSNHDSASALRLLADEPCRFSPILTHQRPLSAVQSAFEMCQSHADGVGKFTLTL
jgi:L-iditol 2-dehydrogenase